MLAWSILEKSFTEPLRLPPICAVREQDSRMPSCVICDVLVMTKTDQREPFDNMITEVSFGKSLHLPAGPHSHDPSTQDAGSTVRRAAPAVLESVECWELALSSK